MPNPQATVEGNSNLNSGFGTTAPNGQRFQQICGFDEFAAQPGLVFLTGVAFRPDAQTGRAFDVTIPDIQINLSTTMSRGPDDLLPTFAANLGANDTVVLDRGPLSLSSSFSGAANGPKLFDIHIFFDTPFLYSPLMGSLLMDVRLFEAIGGMGQFDSEDTLGDGVSRVFTDAGSASGVNGANGRRRTDGYVTQFLFAEVPEPSTALLLGAGLVGLARRRATS